MNALSQMTKKVYLRALENARVSIHKKFMQQITLPFAIVNKGTL
jgi:hypothetical protein